MAAKRNDRPKAPSKSKEPDKTIYEILLQKIERPDLLQPCKVELLGYDRVLPQIEDQIAEWQNFIVSGPSGVGKTTVIRKIAEGRRNPPTLHEFLYIDASWTTSKQFGDQELELGALFRYAVERAPSIIFIDEIESICCKKRNQSDLERRISNKLKNQLTYLKSLEDKRVLVIAATDQPEQLDPQITKFFPEEIRFPLPNRDDRIFKLSKLFPHFTDSQREIIADATNCYLFNDLDRLHAKSRDGAFSSVQRILTSFKPKTIKNYTTPCPPLRWSDIGGVENVKRELQRTVIKPLKDRKRFEWYCATRSRGAILYGPPGCSKTMLAQALATESGYNFISIKGPELFCKWVGDSEAAVRRLYRNAREIAPCIIFFDEIDGFATERTENQGSSVGDKVVTQLLTEFNGPPDDVFTIAATNRPDRVDSALMRPGRLDSQIYIELPDVKDRAEIFKVHTRSLPVKFEEPSEVFDELAKNTCNYSGAEIAKVCRVAGEIAWDESEHVYGHIEKRHFDQALELVRPVTRLEHLKIYEKFQRKGLKEGNQRPSLGGGIGDKTPSRPDRDLSIRFNDSLDLDGE